MSQLQYQNQHRYRINIDILNKITNQRANIQMKEREDIVRELFSRHARLDRASVDI